MSDKLPLLYQPFTPPTYPLPSPPPPILTTCHRCDGRGYNSDTCQRCLGMSLVEVCQTCRTEFPAEKCDEGCPYCRELGTPLVVACDGCAGFGEKCVQCSECCGAGQVWALQTWPVGGMLDIGGIFDGEMGLVGANTDVPDFL